MEIKIQLKNGKVLCIHFGRVTKWFECMDLFHITVEEYNDNREVVYAWYKIGLFREKEPHKFRDYPVVYSDFMYNEGADNEKEF